MKTKTLLTLAAVGVAGYFVIRTIGKGVIGISGIGGGKSTPPRGLPPKPPMSVCPCCGTVFKFR